MCKTPTLAPDRMAKDEIQFMEHFQWCDQIRIQVDQSL